MKILQLHREEMYPPTSGGERRIWETAKKLTDLGTLSIATPYLSAETPPIPITEMEILPGMISKKSILFHCWTAGMLIGPYNPIDLIIKKRILSTPGFHELVLNTDVLVCEAPQFFSTATKLKKDFDVKLITTFHNAWHHLYVEHLKMRKVPSPLIRLVQRNILALEKEVIRSSDAVIFQSDADQSRYEVPNTTRDIVIPNGCNYQKLSNADSIGITTKYELDPDRFHCIFVGSYDYGPNREAVTHIEELIAPELPEIEFLLVGRDTPKSTLTNIRSLGFVEDLPGILAFADCALCPLTTGSGTKLKMLDYLAAGLPTVTTPTGAQGLSIVDGIHCLVRDLSEFSSSIERLKSDPVLREGLMYSCREVGQQHDWSKVMEGYDVIFENLSLL